MRYVPHGDQKEGQLFLSPGDLVWVLEEANGWCGGHKEGDEQTGWFPASVIRKIPRGDCIDDEEEDRKSSALYTSDHRAVASPQTKHRKVSAVQNELAETKQRLEAVEGERSRLDDQLKRAHGEWEVERQRLSKKCEELHAKAQSFQDDSRRKEEELRSLKERLKSETERKGSLEGKLKELEDHCNNLKLKLQFAKDGRDEGMSKSTSGISRACDGHRTPSVPHTVSGVLSGSLQAPPAPCAAVTPTSSSVAMGQVSPSPLSARQPPAMSSRHASPRHGTTSWMPPPLSNSGSGLPASPYARQRVPSQRDLAVNSTSHAPPVRDLVSQFEKRSTSYGAPTARETSSSVLYTATASSPSSCSSTVRHAIATVPVLSSGHVAVTSSTVRAGSREAPIHVSRRVITPSGSGTAFQVEADPETPNGSHVTHFEDISRNFGMSPMTKRQACTLTRGIRGAGHAQMAYSPPLRTTSVKDTINQFETRYR